MSWYVGGVVLGSVLAVGVCQAWVQRVKRYQAMSRLEMMGKGEWAVAELWAQACLGFAAFGVWVACVGVGVGAMTGLMWIVMGR